MPLFAWAVVVLLACGSATATAAPPELRHGSYVHAVAYSPDGKHLASASNDETVRIWDSAASKEDRRLAAEEEYIEALAFSPDGRWLATGSKEKTVSLWGLDTGKREHRLTGHEGAVHAVAFSPDGRLLVSGGEGSELIVWDAAAGKELRRLRAPHRQIDAIVFAPAGTPGPLLLAAAGRRDALIAIWDPATGKELRQTRTRHGPVACLAFSPNGDTLAAAGSGSVRFYAPASLVEIGRQSVRAPGVDGVFALAYSFDGKYLVTGGQDKSVRLFELGTEEEVLRWTGLHDWVYSVAFAPDGRTVAVGDHGYQVRLWDVSGAGAEAAPPSPDELPGLWEALTDAPSPALRAVGRLAAYPDRTLPYLRERLAKLPPTDHALVDQLLKDLAGDDFERRERAARDLEKRGQAVKPALRKALAGKLPSLESRRRLERVLERLDGPIRDPEILRAMRLTAALERMRTPEARELLENLAKTEAETWLAKEARAARDRLAKR